MLWYDSTPTIASVYKAITLLIISRVVQSSFSGESKRTYPQKIVNQLHIIMKFIQKTTSGKCIPAMTLLRLCAHVILISVTSSNVASDCTVTDSLTEGPFYINSNQLIRSDITDGQDGDLFELEVKLVDSSCNSVKGARIDVWHANSIGQYSGVLGNTESFLRGSQFTDENGIAAFKTIFPGWYPGRVWHIHFKIWYGEETLTSQWFAPDDQVAEIYEMCPVYYQRGDQDTALSDDWLFLSLQSPTSNILELHRETNTFDEHAIISSTAFVVVP